MINYLKGELVGLQTIDANRSEITLEIGGIGYAVRVPNRLLESISLHTTVQIYTIQTVKEEEIILYGFGTVSEKDLFRQLVSVSGIGGNTAISLLNSIGLPELVQAIVSSNVRLLSKAPGVGIKTAERLALELKTKLKQWHECADLSGGEGTSQIDPQVRQEVEMTLLALGYTDAEISRALQTIAQDSHMLQDNSIEEWLRSAIACLNKL
jgi:Holliday junction DNA helicase RuvA